MMKSLGRIIVAALAVLPIMVHAQTDSVLYIQPEYIRATTQNDYFQYYFQDDRYFTGGVTIEMAHPAMDGKFSNAVLLGLGRHDSRDFSLSVSQDAYTPEDTKTTEIDTNDRPYAGLLYMTFKKNTGKFWKGERLESKLFFGIMGPAANAGNSQRIMHQIFIGDDPEGWDNQLANALILDYAVQYDKLLPMPSSVVEWSTISEVHLGSLMNYLGTGLQFRIGRYGDNWYNFKGLTNGASNHLPKFGPGQMSAFRRAQVPDRIESIENSDQRLQEIHRYYQRKVNRVWQAYLVLRPLGGLVLYDGTAQGGLLAFDESPHTLDRADINPWFWAFSYDVVLAFKGIQVKYSRTITNNRYEANEQFGWGELDLIIQIN